MNAEAARSLASPALPVWRDPAVGMTLADIFAVLTALALPWSTSLTAIFVLFWLLAAVGTLWSDAPWGARLYAVSPALKLLVLPGLFYHFERSARGLWVFTAFLVSCTLLMLVSWIVLIDPSLSLKPVGEVER